MLAKKIRVFMHLKLFLNALKITILKRMFFLMGKKNCK